MDIVVHFIFYNILIALLLESIAIGWFFDCDKISSHINQHSIIKVGKLWRLMLRFIVPITILLLLAYQLKLDFSSLYKNYPLWSVLVFGLGTVAASLVIAFLMPQKVLERR